VFGNRAYGWKLAGAIALVLALGALSGVRGPLAKPAAWECLAQPERWDGRELWIPGGLVLSADADGFLLEAGGLPLRVQGRAALAAGDRVGVAGTFEAAGPRVRLREWRKSASPGWTRRLMEAVSIAVLAVVLLNFLRHFAVRPEKARVEGAS
jgi:hypothetical protein